MSRSLLMILTVLTATLVAAPVGAIEMSAGGGVGFPVAPSRFSDLYDVGYHGFAGVGRRLTPLLMLDGRVEFNSYGSDELNRSYASELEPTATITVSGGRYSSLLVGIGGRLQTLETTLPLHPYASLRIGAEIWDVDGVKTVHRSPSETFTSTRRGDNGVDPFVELGLGAQLVDLGPGTINLEARYVFILAGDGQDDTSYIPISVGYRF